ncbi:MAG: Na/Pi cotransporter family protein [Firmicutes bacterium]|nr:Na/Pi cotransporter family protein [Bacillota bacterium]
MDSLQTVFIQMTALLNNSTPTPWQNFLDVFSSVAMLLTGIAVFLLGIKFMSNGLDKGAGKAIKSTFVKIGDNRFSNAGIGFGATATIQSSTAVTVMIVGFTNAGVITLLQATAMIMGANVGTTLTAFFGVIEQLPISWLFMMSGIVGVGLYFFGKKPKLKIAGEIITGLSLVFVGMHFMGRAFRDGLLADSFRGMFQAISANPVGPLLLLLIAITFTAINQSSTATTAMAVVMAGYTYCSELGGYYIPPVLPLEAAIFIIIGANIGTTLTALIASIGASSNAKRAALVHLFYNLFGPIVFIPILWPLQNPIAGILFTMAGGDLRLAAAFIHLLYNILLFGLMIGFTKPLAKLVTKIVPDKEGEESKMPVLSFINEKAEVPAHEPVIQEIVSMAALARENFKRAFKSAIVPDLSEKNKIVSTEQKINYINKGISRYLVRLNKDKDATHDFKLLNPLHYVLSDVERIGDHAMGLLDETVDMIDQKVSFSEPAKEELIEMFEMVDALGVLALEIFESRDKSRFKEILGRASGIDAKKQELAFGHINRLNRDECGIEAGIHFYAIVTGLERAKHHYVNLAFSVKSTAGAEVAKLKKLTKASRKRRAAKKPIYW